MAAKPRQEFWLLVIWLLVVAATRTRWLEPEEVTGPVVLKSAADLYLAQARRAARSKVRSAIREVANLLPADLHPKPKPSNLKILPSREWFAIDWTDPIHLQFSQQIVEHDLLDEASKMKLFPESSVVSYWAHSW